MRDSVRRRSGARAGDAPHFRHALERPDDLREVLAVAHLQAEEDGEDDDESDEGVESKAVLLSGSVFVVGKLERVGCLNCETVFKSGRDAPRRSRSAPNAGL